MSARSTFSTPCMHSSPTASISYPKNMFCRCLVCCSFVVQYWLTRPSPSVSPAGFRGSSSQRPRPFLLSLPAATGGGGRRGGPAYPYTHSCIPPGPPRRPTAKRASERGSEEGGRATEGEPQDQMRACSLALLSSSSEKYTLRRDGGRCPWQCLQTEAVGRPARLWWWRAIGMLYCAGLALRRSVCCGGAPAASSVRSEVRTPDGRPASACSVCGGVAANASATLPAEAEVVKWSLSTTQSRRQNEETTRMFQLMINLINSCEVNLCEQALGELV